MSSLINFKLNINWCVQIPPLFISNHVSRGLCKIFGYESLEHGTSFSNYISILKSGGNPQKGGETTSLAYNADIGERAQNYFYVFRDSKVTLQGIIPPDEPQDIKRKIGVFCLKSISRRIYPFPHIYYSYTAEYKKKHLEKDNVPKWIVIGNVVRSFFTPRVRFMYTLEEISSDEKQQGAFLEEDDDYAMGLAYKTRHHLPNDRIGLLGLFRHVQKDQFLEHIYSHPCKVIQGIGQLSVGIFLTYFGLGLFF